MTQYLFKEHAIAGKTLVTLTSLLFVFTLVQHLLPPNGFSATVMVFDYELGLIRRGLFGEVMNGLWGQTVSRQDVLLAALVTTGFAALGLYWLARRWLFASHTTLFLAILMFGSFAFRGLIGSSGYLDHVLLGYLIIALSTSATTYLGLFLRALACLIGVFTHEVMLPYFAVFLTLDVWLAHLNAPVVQRWLRSLVVFGTALAAFLFIAVWGELPNAEVETFRTHIQEKTEFTADSDAMDVIGKELADNLEMMEDKRVKTGYRAWVIFDGMPLLAMSLWLLWLNIKVLPQRAGWITKTLLAGAIFAPLSLNVIAFDVIRFGVMSVMVGFLALISQIRYDAESTDRLKPQLGLGVFLVVLILNLNVQVYQLNEGTSHEGAFPWVVLLQLEWFK